MLVPTRQYEKLHRFQTSFALSNVTRLDQSYAVDYRFPHLWLCFTGWPVYPRAIMMLRGNLYEPSSEDRLRVRNAAIRWACETVNDPDTLYLDTETTGLDASAEIVEISVVDADGVVLLDTLVRPQSRIPPDAEAVHGISNVIALTAPEWPQVYGDLVRIIERRRVVVYNAEFDFRLVTQMNGRHRIHHALPGWQCAMRQFSGYSGQWHAKYGNYRWHRLDHAVAVFGHQPGGHRALGDALACRLVVQGMAGSG
jgi:DNA polymerase III subunit epsilon